MNLIVVILIALVALCIGLILSRDLRHWMSETLQAIGLLLVDLAPGVFGRIVNVIRRIFSGIRTYIIILFITAIVSLLLITISLLINSPMLTAFSFVLAISLMIVAWLPAGLVLRLFRLTDGVIPSTLKVIISWVAFVGWLGLMCPEVLTFRSLLGAALVGFIFLGVCEKINVLDKIIAPLVIIMCLWTAWGFFWPESFRSTTRYTESWAKRIQTHKDRGSIDNETDAATTYGVILKDAHLSYGLKISKKDTVLTEHPDTLITGTIVKIANHKMEVKVIDGQGFVQIIKAKKNGSFVSGKKVWIEAEYVQLAGPREIVPTKDLKDLQKTPVSSVSTGQKVGGEYMVGEHQLALKNGEESDWCIIQPCHAYMFSEAKPLRVQLTFEDGTSVNSWELNKWPNKYKFKIKNLNDEMPILKVI